MDGSIKVPRTWSIQCLIDWLKVREEGGYSFPANADEFAAEVDHSALLRRLMEGKAPLPNPPPLSHSYPWYELVETGSAVPIEVWEADDRFNAGCDYKALVINQHPWRIIEKKSNDDFLITYGNGQEVFRCWSNGIASDAAAGLARKSWKLQKIK